MRHILTFALPAGVALLVASCSQGAQPVSPSVEASPSNICAEVRGSWDQAAQTCSLTGTNAKRITVQATAKYPTALVGDPTAGPPLKEFLRQFFAKFAHPDDGLTQDGSADLTYQIYEHGPDVKSVVFNNTWYLGGAHPNNEIDTFTFDLKDKKELALADLFCAGTDPLKAVPPIVRPYVEHAANPKNDPEFDISRYEPDGGGDNYAENYKAWYLDGDDLVLVMPAERDGPAYAGMWQPHIPLTALRPILRASGCSA